MEKFLGKVTQGDSLLLLNELPNESIDLIVTDPPYGDGVGYGRNNKEIANNEDESINYKVLPLLYDKLKVGGGAIYLLIGSFLISYSTLLTNKHNLI